MIGRLLCRWFHHSISTPVRGKYRCWICLREYAVDWAEPKVTFEVIEIPEAKIERKASA